jgi:hypothetical protein
MAATIIAVHGSRAGAGETPLDVDWIRQLGTRSKDRAYSVAVDSAGNALISGFTEGSLGGPNAGNQDAFVAKFSASICPADFVTSDTFQPFGDGQVDGADLAYLLGEWGANPGSLADIVTGTTFQPPPDGVVDAADLAFLLGAWGACE